MALSDSCRICPGGFSFPPNLKPPLPPTSKTGYSLAPTSFGDFSLGIGCYGGGGGSPCWEFRRMSLFSRDQTPYQSPLRGQALRASRHGQGLVLWCPKKQPCLLGMGTSDPTVSCISHTTYNKLHSCCGFPAAYPQHSQAGATAIPAHK